MVLMKRLARRLLRSESGATAIEYCLIGGAMALALTAALPNVTGGIATVFGRIAAAFAS